MLQRTLFALILLSYSHGLALAQQEVNPYGIRIGQGAGEVAAGNDSRITGALQANHNLSELTNTTVARSNLGLGPLASLSSVENLSIGGGILSLTSINIYTALGYAPVNPASLAPSATSDTTDAANIITGVVNPARLPKATSTNIGGVLAGNGLAVDASGSLSVSYGISSTTAAQGNDARIIGALAATTAATTYAPLASPILTGIPTAPTPTGSDSSNTLATTLFVNNAIAGTASNYLTTINTTGGTTTWTPVRIGGIAVILGSLSSNATIIAPTIGTWTVVNRTSGAYSVTVKTLLGTGIVVAQGASASILGDNTNIVRGNTDFSYGLTMNNASLNGATLNTSSLQNSAITHSTLDSTPIGQTTPAIASISNLIVTGSVSGAGITAFMLPYAPIASPKFTGTVGLSAATWTDTQTCTVGQISVDANYIYVCTATNTVKRAALSSF